MRKYASEFIGTFILVFCGCGSMLASYYMLGAMGMPIPLGFTTLTVALGFGLITTVLYYLFKDVSGAHMNPAISVAVLINGGFNKKSTFIWYLVAQFLGAAAGGALLWAVTGQRTYLGQTGYDDQSSLYIGMIPAIIIEIVLTMVLVFVFLKMQEKPGHKANKAIILGIAISALYTMAVPFTGASLNPARSFGPAIIILGDVIVQYPVFLISPIVGAIIGAFLYRWLLKEREEEVILFEVAPENTEETVEETIAVGEEEVINDVQDDE